MRRPGPPEEASGSARSGEREARAARAKHTMGWSTYLNALHIDYDTFTAELDAIIRSQADVS